MLFLPTHFAFWVKLQIQWVNSTEFWSVQPIQMIIVLFCLKYYSEIVTAPSGEATVWRETRDYFLTGSLISIWQVWQDSRCNDTPIDLPVSAMMRPLRIKGCTAMMIPCYHSYQEIQIQTVQTLGQNEGRMLTNVWPCYHRKTSWQIFVTTSNIIIFTNGLNLELPVSAKMCPLIKNDRK